MIKYLHEVKQLKYNLEKLVKELRNGDESAFNKIYENTYRKIYFIVLPILKDKSLTEDIIQDTYIKFMEKLYDFKNKNVLAYLIMIAKNKAINEYNKRKRTVSVDDEMINYQFSYNEYIEIDAANKELIENALNVLDITERNIFLLHNTENMTHREISNILDKPLGTVTWLYSRAINKLRKYLKDVENED